jgi:hypothetical protein
MVQEEVIESFLFEKISQMKEVATISCRKNDYNWFFGSKDSESCYLTSANSEGISTVIAPPKSSVYDCTMEGNSKNSRRFQHLVIFSS